MNGAEKSSGEFIFNHDYRLRDSLLEIKVDWEDEDTHGGISGFDSIDRELLEELLKRKFINPDFRQNQSPTIAQFLDFMRRHSAVRAFGYAVSPFRDDYRVAIEGLFVAPDDVTPKIRAEFAVFCSNADELETGMTLNSWWD